MAGPNRPKLTLTPSREGYALAHERKDAGGSVSEYLSGTLLRARDKVREAVDYLDGVKGFGRKKTRDTVRALVPLKTGLIADPVRLVKQATRERHPVGVCMALITLAEECSLGNEALMKDLGLKV